MLAYLETERRKQSCAKKDLFVIQVFEGVWDSVHVLLAELAILNSLAQTKVGMQAKSGAGDKIGG